MRRKEGWIAGGKHGKMVCYPVLAALLLTIASCGARDAAEGEPSGGMSGLLSDREQEETESEAVAEFQYMPMSEPLEKSIEHDYAIDGEWLYYTGSLRNEEGGDPYYTQVSRKRISDGYLEEGYIVSTKSTWEAQEQLIFADGMGNCYIFWKPSPTTVREVEDIYSLAKYGSEGELLWYVDFAPEELLDLGASLELGAVTEDGRVFLFHYGEEGHVFAFGRDGRLEGVYTPDLKSLQGVAAGMDGKVYGYCLTGEEPQFTEIGEMGETYICPVRPMEVYSGSERGICLRTGSSMWSYDPKTGEAELLWDWESDYVQLDGGQIDRFFCNGEVCQMLFKEQVYYNSNYTRQLLTFASLSFQDGREYPGKQTVTLSSLGPESDYYRNILVKLYNRYSDKYRIKVIRVNSAEALEMQLIQGKAADLIDISALYADNLAELGAFEDLTDYYTASGAVAFEELLEPVREGCVIRGRNVAVIPAFTIRTIIEKEPWYTAEDWTVWEFLGMGQGRQALNIQDPMEALNYCMGIRYGEHFVDYKKKECRFDSGEFGRILEECGKWNSYDGGWYYTDFGSGDHLFEEKTISSVWSIVSDMDAEYSAKIIGRPGWEGGEHELHAFVSFAMNSASGNKEGAWDFLEYLLSDELQDMEKYWYTGFPVKKDRFEEHLSDLYINPSLLQPAIAVGLPDYEPVIPTEEDIALLRDMVDSSVYQGWSQSNNRIRNIVEEEARMYFAGDCPLDETVEKIQRRVQVYLDEM